MIHSIFWDRLVSHPKSQKTDLKHFVFCFASSQQKYTLFLCSEMDAKTAILIAECRMDPRRRTMLDWGSNDIERSMPTRLNSAIVPRSDTNQQTSPPKKFLFGGLSRSTTLPV